MPGRDLSPQERIARAKSNIDGGAEPGYAIAHTLIAIAEIVAGWLEPAAEAEAEGPIVEWPPR